MLTVAQLTSSQFLGGPERQMLGLARALPADVQTVFLSFAEGGGCQSFLDEAVCQGFEARALAHDTPHFRAATRELAALLRRSSVDVLFCHGYKAGILGRPAARRARIPVVAVSRGWTYESLKIRAYEWLDRINLRWMDRVVCVSQAQAAKVRRAGISARKIITIPNAIRAERFDACDPRSRADLQGLFPRQVRRIVGAAGRLSPEKGFVELVEAAALVTTADPGVGFVLFGDGKLRPALAERIAAMGLTDRFILAGHRTDLDRLLPALDLFVQSSHTEGMPNVILEACAAGVPAVATAVGGTPEIIEHGSTGFLVSPGDPTAIAHSILKVIADEQRRRAVGAVAREHVCRRFSFAVQAKHYRALLADLVDTGRKS